MPTLLQNIYFEASNVKYLLVDKQKNINWVDAYLHYIRKRIFVKSTSSSLFLSREIT